jgi:hypothetical protein
MSRLKRVLVAAFTLIAVFAVALTSSTAVTVVGAYKGGFTIGG